MDEWKPGDRAMVEIMTLNGDVARVKSPEGSVVMIHKSALLPLPQPITPEERVVVDGALAYKDWCRVNRIFCSGTGALFRAIEAHLASIAPVDPVKELREGWALAREYVDVKDIELRCRLDRAIAALEAK